jgi:P27 family predicted phage terminase small subunit
MGKRGPKPTPTKILQARGSWRGYLNRGEPVPPAGRPECPDWVSPAAWKAWWILIPMLEEMGILSRIDQNALVRYVVTLARWHECEQFLLKGGMLVESQFGTRTHPYTKEVDRLATQLGRLEQSFGLNPSARARLSSPEHHGEKTPEEKQKADLIKFRKDA